jgi:2-isopropylmalate synthase
MGHRVLATEEALAGLTELSRYVSELANLPHNEALPYVGANAFAHKAGSSQCRGKKQPHLRACPAEACGNTRHISISDYSGKSTIEAKAREFRVDFTDKSIPAQVVARVKEMENEGFQFEGASASFELLLKQATGEFTPGFELKGFRVINQKMGNESSVNEATIKVVVDGREELAVAEGDGPVNALDNALRKVLVPFYPA